jgi:5-methylcytosine-specific restriction endonuclease McrA
MSRRSLMHLSRKALLDRLHELLARERHLTVEILEVLIEADWRRLWAKAGHPSMYAWCMGALGFSEDMAAKRICAARQARRHPVILDMVADGRLHLSGLLVLAPKLREAPERAAELLAASAHRSRRAIEVLLAERFPQSDVATQVTPISNPFQPAPPAPGRVEMAGPDGVTLAEACAPAPAPGRVAPTPGYSRVAPLAPQRYAVQFTMDEAMHADLIRVQELLGPQADEDRVRAVFRRALHELVTTLEKRKFAATDRPRPLRHGEPSNGEDIPAQVRREVRQRDEDRCAWVTEDGRRCEARSRLQYDHIKPVGKGGGGWTADNVRLLCAAHNQLAAEPEYGEGFMHGMRDRNRRGTEARRERSSAAAALLAPA